MKEINKRVFVLAACVILLTGVIGQCPADAGDKIRYVGSSTVGVFMKAAAKVYKNAEFSINTEPESGGGETAAAYGKTDIGGVAREVRPEILEQGVKTFLIGKDAIGVWVHAKNPVADLSLDQLKGIFTGRITNWKEVGGEDLPINVYIVNHQSATRKVFKKAVLGQAGYDGSRIRTVRPDPAIIDKVAGDISGIGQLSLALGISHPAAEKVRAIAVDGQAASVDNPGYQIYRPLYLVTKGQPMGSAAAFISWALSAEGQAIVKTYFVGIK